MRAECRVYCMSVRGEHSEYEYEYERAAANGVE
jgi:hypothetical protein